MPCIIQCCWAGWYRDWIEKGFLHGTFTIWGWTSCRWDWGHAGHCRMFGSKLPWMPKMCFSHPSCDTQKCLQTFPGGKNRPLLRRAGVEQKEMERGGRDTSLTYFTFIHSSNQLFIQQLLFHNYICASRYSRWGGYSSEANTAVRLTCSERG